MLSGSSDSRLRRCLLIAAALHALLLAALRLVPPRAPPVGLLRQIPIELQPPTPTGKLSLDPERRVARVPDSSVATNAPTAPDPALTPGVARAASRARVVTDPAPPGLEPEAEFADAIEQLDRPHEQQSLRPGVAREHWLTEVPELSAPGDLSGALAKARSHAQIRQGYAGRRERRVGLGGTLGSSGEEVRVISAESVFGDQRGAFKGKICNIEPGTHSLMEIQRCPPIVVFYTDRPGDYTKMRWMREGRREWFAVDIQGKFSVSKAGWYRFRLLSHDGSMLWIDGKPLLNNDGLHPPKSVVGGRELSAGSHRMRLMHFQGRQIVGCGALMLKPPTPAPATGEPGRPERRSTIPPVIVEKKCRAGLLELHVMPPGLNERRFGPKL